MITSVQNSKVKEIKLLQQKAKVRKQQNSFIVEGVRLAEEAVKAGWTIAWCALSENVTERGRNIADELAESGVIVEEVSPHVMKAISDVDNPSGILLEVEMNVVQIKDLIDFVLICDQIRNPGNLGTILRSSLAAGAQQVILTEGTVDPFSPKVLRAGMGAQFRLPISQRPIDEIGAMLIDKNFNILLADGDGKNVYFDQDLKTKVAIVIGSEAHGPSELWKEFSPISISIPTSSNSESLNAAIAASIIMFEVARQRGIN